MQELQMENTNLAQRYKVLESENKLLMSETEQLREVSSGNFMWVLCLSGGDSCRI